MSEPWLWPSSFNSSFSRKWEAPFSCMGSLGTAFLGEGEGMDRTARFPFLAKVKSHLLQAPPSVVHYK